MFSITLTPSTSMKFKEGFAFFKTSQGVYLNMLIYSKTENNNKVTDSIPWIRGSQIHFKRHKSWNS